MKTSFRCKDHIPMFVLFCMILYLIYDSRQQHHCNTLLNLPGLSLHWLDPRSQPMVIREFNKTTGPTKTIVWFDVYHRNRGLRNGVQYVNMAKCAYSACKVLHYIPDQDFNLKNPMHADALVFQMSHLKQWPVPPKRLHPDVAFILAEREAYMPVNSIESRFETDPQLTMYKDVFNWTMTFRQDSDIYFPYGHIRRIDSEMPESLAARAQRTDGDYRTIYRGKTKNAIWFVSHCDTRSMREDYVKELSKYTSVDIFGRCGKTIDCIQWGSVQGRECLTDMIKEYKFVLNFENAFYTDYVTEKLFDWYPMEIVQVVYGSADYSNLVPDGTLLDARDFDSPKELAQRLNQLGNDEYEYISFLKKKKDYYSVQRDMSNQIAYCEICKRLHNINDFRKTYSHIGKWWKPNNRGEYFNKYILSLKANQTKSGILNALCQN